MRFDDILQEINNYSFSEINQSNKRYQEIKRYFLVLFFNDHFKIPMLPKIAQKLLHMLYNPQTNFNKIATLIENDPFISAKLLQISNSPYYRSRNNVLTINDAISRLGLDELKRIVIIIALSPVLIKKGNYRSLFIEFWKHSVASALIAKDIATVIGIDQSQAYTAALLHDIGRSFLLMALIDIEEESKIILENIKIRQLTLDLHTKLGHFIAKRWQLPEKITSIIACHHQEIIPAQSFLVTPTQQLPKIKLNQSQKLLLTIQCADRLAVHSGFGDEKLIQGDILDDQVFSILGISQKKATTLINEINEKYPPLIKELIDDQLDGS